MQNCGFNAEAYENGIKRKRKSRRKIVLFTAIIVLAVLLLNVGFTALAYKFLLYTDLTSTRYTTDSSTLYTLTDNVQGLLSSDAIPMIEKVNADRATAGEAPIKLNIIFCADADMIESEELMRYISYTARGLEKKFPEHINVEYVNITKNPTAVQKYKITSAANIYPSNVIVEFGSEFTVLSYKSFYTANSDSDAPWAYNGEKRFAAAILSVTRAESPICCITTNHGEDIYNADGTPNPEYTTFISIIEGSGYTVQPLNLEADEIPADCRMIITFNPKTDFRAFGNLGDEGVSEIQKLDKFLDGSNTFLYVASPDSEPLSSLDEYLEEWGITIAREEIAGELIGHTVKDTVMNVDEGGAAILGMYTTEGLGAAICEDLLELAYPPKAVFNNTGHIEASESYTKNYVLADSDSGREAYEYYKYYKNGISRNMYSIFTTYNSAEIYADGRVIDMASDARLFNLFTITEEVRDIQEDSYNSVNNASYVLAAASTEFFSNDALNSKSYGNTDILLSTLRQTGREIVPVSIDLKAFYVYDMQVAVITTKQAAAYMWTLALVPSIAIFIAGAVICIKRKNK